MLSHIVILRSAMVSSRGDTLLRRDPRTGERLARTTPRGRDHLGVHASGYRGQLYRMLSELARPNMAAAHADNARTSTKRL